MRYVVAWAILGAVVYTGFAVAQKFQNPWAARPSIVELLPPAHDGCGKDCKP